MCLLAKIYFATTAYDKTNERKRQTGKNGNFVITYYFCHSTVRLERCFVGNYTWLVPDFCVFVKGAYACLNSSKTKAQKNQERERETKGKTSECTTFTINFEFIHKISLYCHLQKVESSYVFLFVCVCEWICKMQQQCFT